MSALRLACRASSTSDCAAPLIVGCVVHLSTSLLQTSIAFLLQDRLGLTPTQTVSVAGLTLLAGGVPMLVVQALVIPRLDWDPARLVATGVPLTALAFATIAGASTLWLIVAATVLSGIGHSLAIPGYAASVSLSVGPTEQDEPMAQGPNTGLTRQARPLAKGYEVTAIMAPRPSHCSLTRPVRGSVTGRVRQTGREDQQVVALADGVWSALHKERRRPLPESWAGRHNMRFAGR